MLYHVMVITRAAMDLDPDPFSKWTQLSDPDPEDPFATLDINNLARYPKAYLMVSNEN